MAKRRKYKSSKSSKCPEPLNTLIDIAGAAAMGAYTRHKIIKDYERGQGESSVKAAMLVHGAGAMRRGSDGLVSLGGMYGVSSALKAIERKERAAHAAIEATARIEEKRMEPLIEPLTKAHTNNNKYAWRLNCEDGAAFGVDPNDYETRDEYNEALTRAKECSFTTEAYSEKVSCHEEGTPNKVGESNPLSIVYRISRLDSGKNEFYIVNNASASVGAKVCLQFENAMVEGIVLSIHKDNEIDIPEESIMEAEVIWIK